MTQPHTETKDFTRLYCFLLLLRLLLLPLLLVLVAELLARSRLSSLYIYIYDVSY